ncbi:MAG: ABC transporter permease [Pseudomonadota bacterium]|nr:ABC transporter permease [Rubrivivax sp.]MCZ8032307.1 ABC transporter permease [Rubrivivax sp.]
MTKIVLRRLAMLVLVIFGVSVICFVISRLIPGDPAQMMLGPRATPQAIAEMRSRLGLDQPVTTQYIQYMSDLLRGDFGVSIITRQPVLGELWSYIPATLELMLMAMVLSIVVGVPLGVLTALRRDTWVDNLGRGLAILGISAPTFWLGLMLMLLLYAELGWLPGSGRLDIGVTPPPHVTGLYLIDAAIAGDGLAWRSAFNHLLLPAITLALASVGTVVRLVRGSMIEVLSEDYIRTARAYGLAPWRIHFVYALKNALIPFVTVLGLELASLLFGSVVVESVFAWPGVGNHVLGAILNLDFPVIMGFTVLASVVYVLANLLVDLAYLMLDPRIQISA